jgi:hypothetical protein
MPGFASLTNFSVPTTSSGGNSGLLMPKLKYRFRVMFDGFGSPENDTGTELTRQVSEAARPTLTFDDKTIDVYNSTIHYAGKPKWGAISIKIRDDQSNVVNKLVGEQNQKQFDFFEQSSAAAAGSYKFKMTIEMLDGANADNFSDVNILESWECYGCYLVSSTYNALTYGDAGFMTIDLSIQPDNCVQLVGADSFGIGYEATDRPALEGGTQTVVAGG